MPKINKNQININFTLTLVTTKMAIIKITLALLSFELGLNRLHHHEIKQNVQNS